jgi:RNA polymerase sigma factor (sigma-70 family)
MYSYSLSHIANLAAQLKRGPVRLRLRQLAGIEFLLSVAEPGREYPLDFVCHALTGFRQPRGGNGSQPAEQPLLRFDPLREDLLTLAEDLSASADLQADAWAEPLHQVTDLAKRFDVSTKTIFRWHHRGLIGWRVRFADRRVRLVFPERCVRRFVAQNRELVQRGSSFSQLSVTERDGIIGRARSLADNGHRTVNAVARAIAGESGRAVETIRLILKQYDEANPHKGVFNRSSLNVDADDARLKMWEAYRDGATVQQLAERFERPVVDVYRGITEMRAREMKTRTIECITHPDFALADAEQLICECSAAKSPSGPLTPPKRIPADLPSYLRHLFHIPLLTREGEVAVFRKLNYLRWKADQLRQQLDPASASASDVDRIETLLERAQEVKNQIVQSNLRLVVSIAKRHVSPNHEFFELVSDGNVSLMRAVDKFDFNRGFKFSTYASWAIMKNFARTVPEERTQRDRYQTGRDEYLENAIGVHPEEHDSDELPALRSRVEHMLCVLDEREQSILRHRYGLDSGGEAQTLEQIGQRLGVSKERVRQLEARAMAKLRTDFTGDVKLLLGA